MPPKAVHWIAISCLWLAACSGGKPVVIAPGAFSADWPSALRAELVSSKKCALDRINEKNPHEQRLSFKSGAKLHMSGWAVPKKEDLHTPLYVQLVGPARTYTALAQQRTKRPDVNHALKTDNSLDAGFDMIATAQLKPGEYAIQTLQPEGDDVTQCDTNVIITIN